jgi:hypothetical protein
MLMCVCVCVFSLCRESPDIILKDKLIISDVVLSQPHHRSIFLARAPSRTRCATPVCTTYDGLNKVSSSYVFIKTIFLKRGKNNRQKDKMLLQKI